MFLKASSWAHVHPTITVSGRVSALQIFQLYTQMYVTTELVGRTFKKHMGYASKFLSKADKIIKICRIPRSEILYHYIPWILVKTIFILNVWRLINFRQFLIFCFHNQNPYVNNCNPRQLCLSNHFPTFLFVAASIIYTGSQKSATFFPLVPVVTSVKSSRRLIAWVSQALACCHISCTHSTVV